MFIKLTREAGWKLAVTTNDADRQARCQERVGAAPILRAGRVGGQVRRISSLNKSSIDPFDEQAGGLEFLHLAYLVMVRFDGHGVRVAGAVTALDAVGGMVPCSNSASVKIRSATSRFWTSTKTLPMILRFCSGSVTLTSGPTIWPSISSVPARNPGQHQIFRTGRPAARRASITWSSSSRMKPLSM